MSGEANIRLVQDDDTERYLSYAQRRHVVAGIQAELDRRERERRDRIVDFFIEAAIVLFTLAALWLVTSSSPYARWGHVVGLASQPFYIAATWRARRWGMFIVALLTCVIWARGIANHFF